jgi:hypothetical protein
MRKIRKKCDAKCERNANAARCDVMSFDKKCECDAKKFSHYHPWWTVSGVSASCVTISTPICFPAVKQGLILE